MYDPCAEDEELGFDTHLPNAPTVNTGSADTHIPRLLVTHENPAPPRPVARPMSPAMAGRYPGLVELRAVFEDGREVVFRRA